MTSSWSQLFVLILGNNSNLADALELQTAENISNLISLEINSNTNRFENMQSQQLTEQPIV